MKIPFHLNQIRKDTAYMLVGILVIVIFVGHILLVNKLIADEDALRDQQFHLKEAILNEVYPDPAEREKHTYYYYYLNKDTLEKSTRAKEYEANQNRIDRLGTVIGWLILAAIVIWPLAVIWVGIWWLRRYWKGEGLDKTSLESRRNRVRVVSTILTATLLTLIIIIWRFAAGQHRTPVVGLIIIALLVAVAGWGFVIALWGLMSSPMSRLSLAMKSAPLSYRIALLMAVVAGVAFVTVGDLNDLERYELKIDSLIYIGVQSSAWLATIIAMGSAMLGYVRLPDEKHRVAVEQKPVLGPTASPPKQDGDAITVIKPSSDEATDLAKVHEKLVAVVSLLESSNHRTTDGAGQNSKKQRAQRSDEIVRQRGEAVRQRLLTEVQSLTRRGNLNLTIGSVTSLIAATILWMLVAQAPTSAHDTTALVGYYVPRLSVAVFIEVFSFFFLRLYKNGLSEIMYYQNELTNLESKMLALEVASLLPSADSVQPILQDLAKTDRNMILKSGESTVELEKIKADQQNVQSLFDSIILKITDVKEAIKVGK